MLEITTNMLMQRKWTFVFHNQKIYTEMLFCRLRSIHWEYSGVSSYYLRESAAQCSRFGRLLFTLGQVVPRAPLVSAVNYFNSGPRVLRYSNLHSSISSHFSFTLSPFICHSFISSHIKVKKNKQHDDHKCLNNIFGWSYWRGNVHFFLGVLRWNEWLVGEGWSPSWRLRVKSIWGEWVLREMYYKLEKVLPT